MLKFSNILMVGAWDVTRFYAMLTFCINLISKELFKIIFLLETIFIFPQHSLSRAASVDYPGCDWLSAYQWACLSLYSLVPGTFYQRRLKFETSNAICTARRWRIFSQFAFLKSVLKYVSVHVISGPNSY